MRRPPTRAPDARVRTSRPAAVWSSAAAILTAYETGRGGFRARSRWEVERGKHGTWQIVVTAIPYQVQKGRLIEQIWR